jgi:hypothetical protein
MTTENKKGIIDSISNWLKLLALVVLVAEAVMITAMSMTPDSSPLKNWYPVFMLLFLLVPVIGLFFDRQMERQRTPSMFDELPKVLITLERADRATALASLIAAYETVTDKAPKAEQPKLLQTSQAMKADLVTLAPEAQQARKQLKELARVYEEMRRDMGPGTGRTLELTSIVTQARALAKQAGYGSVEVSELFAGDSEGSRIVSLAIVQALPDLNFFDLVLQSISNSRSAFEQYQALQAMERLVPLLNADQKRELTVVLKDQRSGGPGKFITKDSDRWLLSSRMLDAI